MSSDRGSSKDSGSSKTKSNTKTNDKYDNLSQIAKSLSLSKSFYNLNEPAELKRLVDKKEEYLDTKVDALNSALEKSNITVYSHDCIRKRSNWVKRFSYDKYNLVDNPLLGEIVSHEEFLRNLKYTSPKLKSLLEKINALDEKDMREHKKRFKHFIFCDVKTGTYGTKMIASGLIASGMKIANTANLLKSASSPSTNSGNESMSKGVDDESSDDSDSDSDKQSGGDKKDKNKIHYTKMAILPDEELKKTRGNNFFVLNSTKLYDRPINVSTKKQILAKFNERPDNIYGNNARIIVMDSGYKEGIDLFDIKYVHIFEPSVTTADQKQVIGRGTRTCGQKGLKFHPTKGWPLHVFVYDMEIPDKLSPTLLNSKTAFDFYMKVLNLDARLFTFSEELEDATIYGSVDYELNKNIHSFSIGGGKDSSSGSSIISLNGGDGSAARECGAGTRKRCPSGKHCYSNKCVDKNYKPPETATECGKGLHKRCPNGKRCDNRTKRCTIKKNAAAASASAHTPEVNYSSPLREPAEEIRAAVELSQKKNTPFIVSPHIASLVSAIKIPPQEEDRMGHKEMREYINKNYSQYKWDELKMENLCGPAAATATESQKPSDEAKEGALAAVQEMSGGATEIIKYSPSQDFIRNYFTSRTPLKGMLLWNSVGTGKTCAAIASATHTFERDGYTILWVTRTTLKNDIWKNMFQQVCHEIIREKIKEGLIIPESQDARMKLLSKSWKIRPMSYKQFSNLVSKNNRFYDDLVKINGEADPLRKTLLIIDEAHKLYGGGDLSSIERPDMKALCEAVDKSYEISGRDSVKLLLMTATPITNDPMELVKLVNMFKPIGQKMPYNFDDFSEMYLDENGKFTQKGRDKYLDDIAGHVSYLNREKDARQFSQPHIQRVYTPIANIDDVMASDKTILTKVYKNAIEELRNEVKEATGAIDKEFGKVKKTQITKELKSVCVDIDDKKDKRICEKIAGSYASELFNTIKEEMSIIKENIKELREKIKNLLLEKKEKAELLKGDDAKMNAEIFKEHSLYREIRRKCNKKVIDEKSILGYINDSQQCTQINNEINEYNEKIKVALDELKTYMDAYNAKMKELKKVLKIKGISKLEKDIVNNNIKQNRENHVKHIKTLKKDVQNKVSDYKFEISELKKDKKVILREVKKSIKKELSRYKKQRVSLKRINKQMFNEINKNLKKEGIDISPKKMSGRVTDMIEHYKKETIEQMKNEISEKAAAAEAKKKAAEERKAAAAAKKEAAAEARKAAAAAKKTRRGNAAGGKGRRTRRKK